MICWLQTRRDLLRANRTLRAENSALAFELNSVRNDLAMWQELSRCPNQQQHIRLAHELHLAQAELQILRGEDSHCASLPPSTLRRERGWVGLLLVLVVAIVLGCAVVVGMAVAHRIDDHATGVRAAMEVLAPVADEETTTSTTTTTTTTTAPPATTTTAAPIKAAASTVRAWTWDDLAQCESGGNWQIHDSIHEGGLQFAISTWDAYKPAGYPDGAHQATREQQITVAELVLADQGPGAWPHCSYEVGMR